MTLWQSDGNRSLPMLPLGNGNLLIWEEGASLYSLRAGYSAPHLLTMTPDFGGIYHEIQSTRLPDGRGMRHRLYYSPDVIDLPNRFLCDLQITDQLLQDEPVLIRRFDGLTRLTFRLSIPSYVRAVYHPSYRFGSYRADTLFLTVPAGTAFDSGFATLREQTVALLLVGSLRYDPLDGSVYYGGDLGELYLLAIDDPVALVRTADRLLKALSHYGETPSLHPYYGSSFAPVPDEPRSTEVSAISHPLCHLLAMQARSGAVTTSHREPYAAAADLPALCALFLREKQEDAARRMLLCWTAEAEKLGFVPSVLSCNDSAVGQPQQPDAASAAAYLLAAVQYCRTVPLVEKDADLLYRGMRRAFSSLLQSFREGMISFGLRTQAFDAGLLGRELLFQGSAEDTALAIRAAEDFAAYCRERGKRIAKEDKGYLTILNEAERSYDDNFTAKGRICRNAPRLEAYTRRPRFIRSVCTLCQRDGAYPAVDTLELDKYGRYLCRRCFAGRRGQPEVTDPAKRYRSPRATAMAALLVGSPAALAELVWIALPYYRRNRDPNAALPMREADTDPLVLLALQTHRDKLCQLLSGNGTAFAAWLKESDLSPCTAPMEAIDLLIESVRAILPGETDMGMLSALLYDTAPLGARCAAGATAVCALALT